MEKSGAQSHVYLQIPPLRCNIPETQGLHYDDGNKLLLSPTADQVLSWKVGQSIQHDPPNSDLIGEGPVLFIRYSLDQKIIGIQRTNQEVEFRNRQIGSTFTRKCNSDSERIFGFFWTDCPICDLIFIKTSGIDLLMYEPDQNTLRLVESKRFSVSWYIYTHESRMVLLSSGMQCAIFSGYQFSASGGIVRLPKFEMSMTKSEANSKPVLASDDVHLVTVYGRIYCLQLDRVGMVLNLYRFYRDAVVQQGTLPVYSSRVAVSAVDNVILVHQVDARVVLLYDLFLDSINPVSAPLPLLIRGINNNINTTTTTTSTSIFGSYEGTVYGESWSFLVPDLICDADNGLLWKICLDLEAIAASSSDIPSILDFLQRRRSNPSKIKSLCLAITRTVILERRSILTIARAMDVLVSSFSHSAKTTGTVPSSATTLDHGKSVAMDPSSSDNDDANLNTEGRGGERKLLDPSIPQAQGSHSHSHSTCVAISPDEMYHSVFALVEDELGSDPSYLVSVILEFLQSASRERISVNPNLYLMVIRLLDRTNRHDDIILFVSNKIIEPSKEVAFELLNSGRENTKLRKLGTEMLRQLSLHHDFVSALLQDGLYIDALRYARKHKVITMQPDLFLEAAVASNKSEHVATVLRFFSDFTPSFKSTLDYGRYHHILTEMC